MNQFNYKEKIRAYFNGQLTAKEEQQLFEWIKTDKENLLFFNAEKEKITPKNIHHELLESSLAELKMKLDLNDQFRSGRKVFLRFSRIAAIFILIVGLGFVFSMLQNNKNNDLEKIVWFETTAPRGDKSKIQLPDGTLVWLNSETTIRYPSNFANNNRQIELDGEAYFEVEKYQGESFLVKTKDYNIKVLGTKFNVMAYADFNRTQTDLIEGRIEIEKDGKTIEELSPGEEIIYQLNQFTIRETDTEKTVMWKENMFDFDQIAFSELVKRLERWYDVEIVVKGDTLPETIYSGVFKNEETIWQVLDILQVTMPFTYKHIDYRKIELTAKP